MNSTQDKVNEVFKQLREDHEARKTAKAREAKESIINKAKKKQKETERAVKDALANSILNQIKEVVEGTEKKKQQQTIISTRTPYDYDYDWVAKKAKDNE